MHDNGASRFDELDPKVKDLLRKLEPEEVEALKYVATIPKDELRGMMKMYRDTRAIGKFSRWFILLLVGLFLGGVTIGENVMKLVHWFKGPSP